MKYNLYYLYFICLSIALGGFLFGFDTAVISGTLSFIKPYFNLNEFLVGITVSSALMGTIVGSVSAGIPAERFGRKKLLMTAAILFILSAIGCGLAKNLVFFIISRIIGGIAVGISSVLAPTYISEISPGHIRGKMVAINQLNIVIGIMLAYFSNLALVDTGENNWRYMFSVEALPAILFLILLFKLPPSPRWLVKKGYNQHALKVLKKINPSEVAMQELNNIKETLQETLSRKEALRTLFRKPYSKLLLIGFLLAMFNQLTGINVIMYYAPVVFEKTGVSTENALFQTTVIGITNVSVTIFAMSIIDKAGRKKLLLIGGTGMIITLSLVAKSFYQQNFDGYWVLFYLIGFIAFFGISQGAVIWVLLSEIFPNKIREYAVSIGVLTHWLFTLIISFLYPVMTKYWGEGHTFMFFAVMMILHLLYVIFMVPETKGKSLEQLENELT